MADVLAMPALEQRDPVAVFVLFEADHGTSHPGQPKDSWRRDGEERLIPT